MKKITLIFAAMLAMAQMNVSATETSTNEVATNGEATTVTAADNNNDEESAYQSPFNRDKKKHWTVMTSGFYLGLGVKHNYKLQDSHNLINNSFEVGLLNFAAVNYNSLHGQNISLGVGIHHRSYSIKRPVMLVRDENNHIIESTYPSVLVDEIKNRSSNVNLWSIQFPLMFTQRIVKKLDITVAGILNWNTFARVDNHYEINKVEHDIKFKSLKQNKVNFDFMGALSWDEFGIYCRYTPSKFFKNDFGPEIKNTWTMGITLGL
ncbi:MAG: hypothetical protein IKI10_04875 [Muribaculaceae bacterium]|nr:hypothetical protein [Muribaculaceae bacterium]